jgi:hypothetical protein
MLEKAVSANLLSRRKAVELAASLFGIEDPEAMLAEIEADRDAEEKRQIEHEHQQSRVLADAVNAGPVGRQNKSTPPGKGKA